MKATLFFLLVPGVVFGNTVPNDGSSGKDAVFVQTRAANCAKEGATCLKSSGALASEKCCDGLFCADVSIVNSKGHCTGGCKKAFNGSGCKKGSDCCSGNCNRTYCDETVYYCMEPGLTCHTKPKKCKKDKESCQDFVDCCSPPKGKRVLCNPSSKVCEQY